MASALNSARPIERQLTKEYLLEGVIAASLVVTTQNMPGSIEILSADLSSKAPNTAGAAAQLGLSYTIAGDRKSLTLFGWDEAGAASAADVAFSAKVLCTTA